MANKDDFIDTNWDDPFGGEFDLDMDFDMDPYAKQGFMGGVTSGFLQGIVSETVGSGPARMRTLRTILPASFSNALDKVSWAADRYEALKTEFKEQNYESAKSLQKIAGSLSSKLEDKMPGMADNLQSFSEKDFSSWEKYEPGNRDKLDSMESTSNYDVDSAIRESMDRNDQALFNLGESLNAMNAAASGMLNGSIMAGNKQLIGIESGVRTLVDWQRNVQLKIDQAKLNLMAKNYVADVKFYKFMEKGVHTEIAELKKITKNSGMSDFQKTTAYTASKDFLRNKLFNTVGSRVGGLGGLIRERYGKENRTETYSAMSELLGGIADIMEESDGAGMSKGMLGNFVGKRVAGGVINNLPHFFERGPGAKIIANLEKKNPEQAAAFKKRYGKLANTGNRASYLANSGTGLFNFLSEDYQAMDEMPFLDYEDYLESLPAGQKPLSKARWTVQNAVGNRAKAGMNSFMSDLTKAKGTQYKLARRNAKDLSQPGIWKEMNNITLNEVIPGLLSTLNQSVEGIRTGTMGEAKSYSYMRGQFMNEGDKANSVKADLMPYSEFSRYANAALEFVDNLDPNKLLSSGARKAFAQQIAKDVDADKSFNPFYYVGQIPGVSPNHQQEIQAVMKLHFGIKDSDIERFSKAKGFEKFDVMSNLSSEKGNQRLNEAGAAAANLKEIYPNVAERIDLLRSTGNEQMLRDIGVIYTEGGIDKVNMSVFHERIGQFMDNPNDPILKGGVNTKQPPKPGKGTPFVPPKLGPTEDQSSSETNTGALNESFGLLNNNIGKMSDLLERLGNPSLNQAEAKIHQNPFSDSIAEDIAAISANTGTLNASMSSFLEIVKEGKIFQNTSGSTSDQKQADKASKNFTSRLKDLFPSKLFGKGVDTIMNNQPMVLATLMGTIGASFIQNPLLAGATIAGSALLGGVVQRWGREDAAGGTGREPSDDEDIIGEDGEPILKSKDLHAGVYIDAVTKRVIKTWKEIKGPIYNTAEKAVIGLKELGGKIFGPDGRAVMLSGVNKVKDAAIAGYNFVNPLQRFKDISKLGKEIVYQQDVFVKGEKNPRLRAIGFKNGDYFCKDTSGKFAPIAGWNEITGAVYNESGDQLISDEEFKAGLVTSSGQAVRNLGGMASNAVGSVVGGAKAAFETLMGKAGFQRTDNNSVGPKSDKNAGNTNGVERRLDKIYALLSKEFGISVDDGEVKAAGKKGGVMDRLNSLADKERQDKEESREKTDEAIQDIAEELKGGKKEEKDPEKKGIFGKLMGMLGGIGSFGMNLIRNPLGAIGGLITGSLAASAGRLTKIGSLLFDGVLGMSSPIIKLLKWGFTGLGKITMMKTAADAAGNLGGGLDGAGGGRGRGRGGVMGKVGRMFGKLPGWGKAVGLLAAGTGMAYGADALMSDVGTNPFEADPFGKDPSLTGGEFYKPEVSKAEQDYQTRQTARDARDQANVNTTGNKIFDFITDMVPQTAITKMIMGEGGKGAMFESDDGKRFLSSEERNAYEDQRDGVVVPASITRDPSKTFSLQKRIRYAQYGIRDTDTELARRIDTLEQYLIPFVMITGNRASFKTNTPIENIIKQFAAGSQPIGMDQINIWFNARFKPIFLIYAVGTSVAKLGDINEFDRNTNYESTQVCERLQSSIATVEPYPLKIHVQIDPNIGLLTEAQTNQLVAQLMAELRKAQPVPKTELKLGTVEESRNKALQGREISSNPIIATVQSWLGDTEEQSAQKAIDEKFKTPKEVAEIDIKDLHKDGDTSLDPFTCARLAIYGNVDNMGWRIDAVLRLERYCENLFTMVGKVPQFNGKPNEILSLFKPMFRIATPIAESNFLLWFENRFLPVMKRYVANVAYFRGSKPKVGWKQLSATNKAMIARGLNELLVVNEKGDEVSIWTIESSPFPSSKSGTVPGRADKFLAMLDAASNEATLKDPEGETERSKTAAQKRAAQSGIDQTRANTQMLMETVYGKQNQSAAGNVGIGGGSSGMAIGANGSSMSPSSWSQMNQGIEQGGGQFDGQWNAGINPEFTQKAGQDTGISMTLEQGDQLMLNTMLKHGITDKKQLAMGLAMARKETGGYQSTVENTNWSAPTLKRLFKNIPDQKTAEYVASLPPAERAMYVYGQNPKAKDLGNQKPEDGWLYRGRGFFQLTGKSNYVDMSQKLGVDLVNNPELVSNDPQIVAESAVQFLKSSPLMMGIAQTGDFNAAARGINGGNAVPATDERRGYYQDYLNRLNNGSLTVPQEVNSPEVKAGTGYEDIASAPDKEEKKDPLKVGGVNATLNAADTTKKLNTQTTTASTKPTNSTVNSQERIAKVEKEVKVKSDEQPARTPPASIAVQKAPAAIQAPVPQQPAIIKQSGPVEVKDQQMAEVMVGLTRTLDNLSQATDRLARQQDGVRT